MIIGVWHGSHLLLTPLSFFSPLRASVTKRGLAVYEGAFLIGAEKPNTAVVAIIVWLRTTPCDHHRLMD